MEDAKIKLELVQWHLGRVAFHQDCRRCCGSLSRKHAVIRSGAEDFLSSTFPDIDLPQSNTLIDSILNQFFFKNDSAVRSHPRDQENLSFTKCQLGPFTK
jgi:hypothetical protein